MKTPEQIAQWVIDNRYPKPGQERLTDTEMYNLLLDMIKGRMEPITYPERPTAHPSVWGTTPSFRERAGQKDGKGKR